jgi:GH25 family lysozyme M1 (1,4-beta-N-acetylmuramidase)
MTLAVDISNYTGPIDPQHVDAWRQAGVGLVIVQAIDPPPGYPAGCTRQQLSTLRDAGMAAEAYIYLWFDADVGTVQHALSLVDGLPIRRIWLDLEDKAAANYNQAATEAKVQAALDACDAYANAHGMPTTGIYTGNWFWSDPKLMGNTIRFNNRLLWDSHYDGVADTTANFRAYGGWSACTIKQHIGTSALGGVTGLDQSVLTADYAAGLTEEEEEVAYPVPEQYTNNGWTTWREVAINLQAIADQLGQQQQALQAELASGTDPDAAAKLQKIRDIVEAKAAAS